MKSFGELVFGILGWFFITALITFFLLLGGSFIYSTTVVEYMSMQEGLLHIFLGGCFIQTGLIGFVALARWVMNQLGD